MDFETYQRKLEKIYDLLRYLENDSFYMSVKDSSGESIANKNNYYDMYETSSEKEERIIDMWKRKCRNLISDLGEKYQLLSQSNLSEEERMKLEEQKRKLISLADDYRRVASKELEVTSDPLSYSGRRGRW